MWNQFRRRWVALGCLPLLALLAGCNYLGPAGAVIANAFPNKVAAQYKGLQGQSVAVMVWADRGIRIDNPYLQGNIAAGIQEKLKALQKSDDPPELKGTTFPISPASVVRYQEDHPEIETMPIEETAARFTVTRLIYIEVSNFSTQSEASLLLSRGTMTGNVKVVEIANGKAKVAKYTEDITVSFPKDSPKEGMPNGDHYKIYQGTLDAFTTEVVYRFYDHEPPDDD